MYRLLPLILILFSASSLAAGPSCTDLTVKDGDVVVLKGELFHAIHITLDDPLVMAPVVGSPKLWDVEGAVGTKHIFVQPTSTLPAGSSTTIAAITRSGEAYDILVKVVPKNSDLCVSLTRGGRFISDASALIVPEKTITESDLNRVVEEGENRAVDAIKRYQKEIFTNYSWAEYGTSTLTKNLVSSVYDNGRFTFIRLDDDKFSLPIIYGVIDGEKQLLEADYDPQTKLYKVAGLYQMLVVAYKAGGINVYRDGYNDRRSYANQQNGGDR